MVLQELYTHPSVASCPHLARLESEPPRLHDGALVLHLVPLGVPQRGPPADEATLKRAVRDVLTGLAKLHMAGEVVCSGTAPITRPEACNPLRYVSQPASYVACV